MYNQSKNVTSITFCGVTLPKVKLASRLPVPQIHNRVKEHYMSEGSSGPGIRVLEPLGAHMSYGSISFRAEGLTAAQIQTYYTAVLNYTAAQTLTISNSYVGSATYQVMFSEDGFKPDLMDELLDYDDFRGTSEVGPYAADFNLLILRRTS